MQGTVCNMEGQQVSVGPWNLARDKQRSFSDGGSGGLECRKVAAHGWGSVMCHDRAINDCFFKFYRMSVVSQWHKKGGEESRDE